jgi:enamine deaminase RidA (YjgF/YER057c/UK114 family)
MSASSHESPASIDDDREVAMSGPSSREAVWPAGAEPARTYSPAIKAGGWVFVSGQIAGRREEGLSPAAQARTQTPFVIDELEFQSREVLGNLAGILSAAGCELSRDVVRIYQWFPSGYPTPNEFEAGINWPRISITPYLRHLREAITTGRPASTGLAVRRLLVPGAKVEVDAIAVVPQPGIEKQSFKQPEGEPAPTGGYSPAIRFGDWIFTAGVIATDYRPDWWATNSSLAREADVNPYQWYSRPIETQTDYLLKRLDAVTREAGTSLARCVKATVYLGHPSDFAGMDRVWKQWFPTNPPARVVVPYIGLGGAGCRVEIALKLLAGDSGLTIETIETSAAPEPIGHQPQAVKAGDLLFLSGQLAHDSNGALAHEAKVSAGSPFYQQSAQLQMRYIAKNVAAICDAAGSSFDKLCRSQAFYDDLASFAPIEEEWRSLVQTAPPASTHVEIGGPMVVPGCHVLLDLIGYIPT